MGSVRPLANAFSFSDFHFFFCEVKTPTFRGSGALSALTVITVTLFFPRPPPAPFPRYARNLPYHQN